ncbi:MAG: hypothetical protein ABJI92_21460 [Kangiellaceae bacterium]
MKTIRRQKFEIEIEIEMEVEIEIEMEIRNMKHKKGRERKNEKTCKNQAKKHTRETQICADIHREGE